MFDIDDFIRQKKAILIAPAGYGKTHTIAASMEKLKENGTHLILTHTHAGLASIKEKLKKASIPSSSFHIETISGFAQRYVYSFGKRNEIPDPVESDYFKVIIAKALKLFALKPVQRVLSRSYRTLFVDEYQDCTLQQHKLILALSNLFPTRFLGDPLQGIFQFEPLDPIVDLECEDQMAGFLDKRYELTEPQRWLRGNNEQLGLDLKKLRCELLLGNPVNLNHYPSIVHYSFDESDIYLPTKPYYRLVSKLLEEQNILILHPTSHSIGPRLKLVKQFKNRLVLLESIDDKDFYNLAQKFDQHIIGSSAVTLRTVCLPLFNKTVLGKWFNERGLISKNKQADKDAIAKLKQIIQSLDINVSYIKFKEALKEIDKLPELRCYRREVFQCLCKALDLAHSGNITVTEAMVEVRNSIRRFGRKANIKCIGTTLLTKGLEFDTVLVLDAHKFNNIKHLYVAFTRAAKRLIIVSKSSTINVITN
ncbi:UvrD-helicase domain-containing protein [Pedobacter suwonensis]|uniref:UvrD-helicase domain-containing protein n=1 Tax=Pedobacter suwonensis TaxID=332999 RepID=UPI0036AE20A7